jgi:hypothetical protein
MIKAPIHPDQSALEHDEDISENFKVIVRVRPLLAREILNGCSFSIVIPDLPIFPNHLMSPI